MTLKRRKDNVRFVTIRGRVVPIARNATAETDFEKRILKELKKIQKKQKQGKKLKFSEKVTVGGVGLAAVAQSASTLKGFELRPIDAEMNISHKMGDTQTVKDLGLKKTRIAGKLRFLAKARFAGLAIAGAGVLLKADELK